MPRGEPITPDQERMLLRLIAIGHAPSRAAMHLGLSHAAVSARKKRDPEFATKVETAEASSEVNVATRLLLLCEKGNLDAIKFFLERRFPERWARPEVRAALNISAVNTEQMVEGIMSALRIVAERHNPEGAVDVDADVVDTPAEDAT